MSLQTAIYGTVQATPALVGVPIYTDWASADQQKGPYVVLSAEATGSGDPPDLIVLGAADIYVYHPNIADAERMSQGVIHALDGRRIQDPEGEVFHVQPVLSGTETDRDSQLPYARTSWDLWACK